MAEPKSRIIFEHDSSPDAPNMIETYVTCRRCEDERPKDQTPAQWARLGVGITETGDLQVWCVRHDVNVDAITVVIESDTVH